MISDNEEFLVGFHYPCNKLAEEGEGWVGNDDVCFVAQAFQFFAAEVTIALKVGPLQVVNVYTAVGVSVVVENEYFAVCLASVCIVVGAFGLVEGWNPLLDFLRFGSVGG